MSRSGTAQLLYGFSEPHSILVGSNAQFCKKMTKKTAHYGLTYYVASSLAATWVTIGLVLLGSLNLWHSVWWGQRVERWSDRHTQLACLLCKSTWNSINLVLTFCNHLFPNQSSVPSIHLCMFPSWCSAVSRVSSPDLCCLLFFKVITLVSIRAAVNCLQMAKLPSIDLKRCVRSLSSSWFQSLSRVTVTGQEMVLVLFL